MAQRITRRDFLNGTQVAIGALKEEARRAESNEALDSKARLRLLDAAFALNHHSSKGEQSHKSITDVGAGVGSMS